MRAGNNNQELSPDTMIAEPLSWLPLILKMGVTAVFVVAASYAAERAGPVVGAMIATLPVGAGPAYVFLALQHDASFIAQGAMASLVVNVNTAIFALTYAVLAQRLGLIASLLPALTLWFGLVSVINAVPWTTMGAIGFTAAGLAVCIVSGNRFRHVRAPPAQQRLSDLLMRAAMAAVLVAVVVGGSEILGPGVTGMFAAFPVVMVSLVLILHPRIGGPATAAVLANALLGLAGFSLCCLAAHLLVERIGVAAGLVCALLVSVGCNLVFWAVRRPSAPAASGASLS